jgi:hypothetical protein
MKNHSNKKNSKDIREVKELLKILTVEPHNYYLTERGQLAYIFEAVDPNIVEDAPAENLFGAYYSNLHRRWRPCRWSANGTTERFEKYGCKLVKSLGETMPSEFKKKSQMTFNVRRTLKEEKNKWRETVVSYSKDIYRYKARSGRWDVSSYG